MSRGCVASRETLRHLISPKTECPALFSLSKTSRHRFHSTATPQLQSSASTEDSSTRGLESSSKINDVHVPFRGTIARAKRPQQYSSPDSKWKRASSPGHSKPRIKPREERVPRFDGKSAASQSDRLRSENRIHSSSRDAVRGPRHLTSTASTDYRSNDYRGATAFSDGVAMNKSFDVSRTRRRRDPKPGIHSHEKTPRESSRINHIQTSNRRSKSETLSLPEAPRESWQIQKTALIEKFGSSGWAPRKRLSPDALEGIRLLHSQSPDKYTTPMLADHFQVSPEAIRRILKSKWRPNEEEEAKRRERWDKRGESIWSQMVEIGIKPPKKWRDMGVGKAKTRSDGTNVVGQKPTIRETLLAAMKPWDSDATTKGSRVSSSPVPLSERIV
ncbi:Required for respiratory growth protein 9 mitochondrial [Pseudocyphellaria aurata]|nr:Required for respiratory growth protein 9 mitochondrial [Pseudocyphellaria aurata]